MLTDDDRKLFQEGSRSHHLTDTERNSLGQGVFRVSSESVRASQGCVECALTKG